MRDACVVPSCTYVLSLKNVLLLEVVVEDDVVTGTFIIMFEVAEALPADTGLGGDREGSQGPWEGKELLAGY